jgi:hypothetical protein
MRKVIADISRLLNRAVGGAQGKTLCWRVASTWGDDCLFCRFVGWCMREPHHCADELTAVDLMDRARRRQRRQP